MSGISLHDPLAGYNFLLRVEAKYDLACKSVQAFRNEYEYEYIQEGGLNEYVHVIRNRCHSHLFWKLSVMWQKMISILFLWAPFCVCPSCCW